MSATSYDQVCAEHRWEVAARYNIASDVCDQVIARAQLAMVWESFDGRTARLAWGELQDLANAGCCVLWRAGRRAQGTASRWCYQRRPRRRRSSSALEAWCSAALDVGAVRRRLDSSSPLGLRCTPRRHRRGERSAFRRLRGSNARARRRHARGCLDRASTATPRPTSPRSSTTRRGRPGSRRASCTPTATSWATRSSSTATRFADGERFHGMGEWAWAAGIAPLLGPWRLGAVQCVYRREAGFDPHRQLDFLSRHDVTNVFTTPTAMRAMMAIDDAGRATRRSSAGSARPESH